MDELQRALPEGEEGPPLPPVEYDSKLHMAFQYQPEPRMIPFGALVWFKDLTVPKSFGPNGHPAIYISPEVLPGLRCTVQGCSYFVGFGSIEARKIP